MKIALDKNKNVLTRLLATRGVPRQTLALAPFEFNESVNSFMSEVDGLKPRRIKKQDQTKHLHTVWDKPFQNPYVYCISGKPNDNKPKLLAAFLMARAIEVQQSIDQRRGSVQRSNLMDKNLPLWHTLTGSYDDDLRQRRLDQKPSLLVLANVPCNSTQIKLEKLRDILEMYDDIPRIIVTCGEDPVTFFNSKIFYHMNYCAYLSTAMKVTTI